jgi:hypothetical protein
MHATIKSIVEFKVTDLNFEIPIKVFNFYFSGTPALSSLNTQNSPNTI